MVKKTWSEFKSLAADKIVNLQYEKQADDYKVWFFDNSDYYFCRVNITTPKNSDQIDFEDNYKDGCNQPINLKWPDGKPKVSSTSRPETGRLQFSGIGDNGAVMAWDFSTTDDVVTAPSGFKRKQIDCTYTEHIWMKEGAVYFKNKTFGSYIDFQIVALAGTPGFHPTEDMILDHFVKHHNMLGDATMGDELNTEAALETPIPPGIVFRFIITVPDTDSISQGAVSLEFYRGTP